MEESYQARVNEEGRVVIPAALRRGLGITAGQELVITRQGGGLLLRTFDQAVADAQAAFAPFLRPGESVVEELVRERREEARREDAE